MKKRKLSKAKTRRKKLRSFNKNLNLIFGTIIFVSIISFAFALDWIFGVGYIIGFLLAVYNKILEKNFLIPIFIFVGALVIRYALFVLLPPIINAKDYFSLGISLVLFLIILFIGWRIRKGKFRF
jgi:hypothetical protein